MREKDPMIGFGLKIGGLIESNNAVQREVQDGFSKLHEEIGGVKVDHIKLVGRVDSLEEINKKKENAKIEREKIKKEKADAKKSKRNTVIFILTCMSLISVILYRVALMKPSPKQEQEIAQLKDSKNDQRTKSIYRNGKKA